MSLSTYDVDVEPASPEQRSHLLRGGHEEVVVAKVKLAHL
jgi:hypothetical protein